MFHGWIFLSQHCDNSCYSHKLSKTKVFQEIESHTRKKQYGWDQLGPGSWNMHETCTVHIFAYIAVVWWPKCFLCEFVFWALIFTCLLLYACVGMHQVRKLVFDNRPYALTSSSRHLGGKTVTKQSKCTDLYARRTGLANEQPHFDR